jgi:hypothetical protein
MFLSLLANHPFICDKTEAVPNVNSGRTSVKTS